MTAPLDAHKGRRVRGDGGRYITKISVELVDKICGVIASAVPMDTAAAYSGISKQTMYAWMRRARDLQTLNDTGYHGPWNEDETILLDFAGKLDVAMAAWEVTALGRITEAAKDHWAAAGWLLERRKPDEYGRRQRLDVANADGQPFRVQATPTFDPELLTDAELDTLVSLLRKAQPAGADVIEMAPRRELTA